MEEEIEIKPKKTFSRRQVKGNNEKYVNLDDLDKQLEDEYQTTSHLPLSFHQLLLHSTRSSSLSFIII